MYEAMQCATNEALYWQRQNLAACHPVPAATRECGAAMHACVHTPCTPLARLIPDTRPTFRGITGAACLYSAKRAIRFLRGGVAAAPAVPMKHEHPALHACQFAASDVAIAAQQQRPLSEEPSECEKVTSAPRSSSAPPVQLVVAGPMLTPSSPGPVTSSHADSTTSTPVAAALEGAMAGSQDGGSDDIAGNPGSKGETQRHAVRKQQGPGGGRKPNATSPAASCRVGARRDDCAPIGGTVKSLDQRMSTGAESANHRTFAVQI